MFRFQSVQFDLVGFVLCLLLQAASPRGQFVLLLPGFRPCVERQLADRRHVVDHPAELVQLLADAVQLFRIRCQIVAVTFACLATVL